MHVKRGQLHKGIKKIDSPLNEEFSGKLRNQFGEYQR